MTTTASWVDLEVEAPELAAAVRACFAVRKHCTLATLRRDGASRISGSEVELADGAVWIGSMPGAARRRTSSATPGWRCTHRRWTRLRGRRAPGPGEAKVAGVAVEVPPADPADASHRFRIDLTEVVHTKVDEAASGLLITSWHPGRGVEQVRRS